MFFILLIQRRNLLSRGEFYTKSVAWKDGEDEKGGQRHGNMLTEEGVGE